MRLNKLTYIIISVVTICILIGITLYSRHSTITIKNNTDKTISGLKINYSNSPSYTEVPQISQNQVYKTKLILPENFIEGSIKIYYADKQGKNHEEYLEGYIDRGYNGKIIVTIDEVDDNGVLSLTIDR